MRVVTMSLQRDRAHRSTASAPGSAEHRIALSNRQVRRGCPRGANGLRRYRPRHLLLGRAATNHRRRCPLSLSVARSGSAARAPAGAQKPLARRPARHQAAPRGTPRSSTTCRAPSQSSPSPRSVLPDPLPPGGGFGGVAERITRCGADPMLECSHRIRGCGGIDRSASRRAHRAASAPTMRAIRTFAVDGCRPMRVTPTAAIAAKRDLSSSSDGIVTGRSSTTADGGGAARPGRRHAQWPAADGVHERKFACRTHQRSDLRRDDRSALQARCSRGSVFYRFCP